MRISSSYFSIPPWLYNRMVGNQAIATIIGFVPVVGDIGIAVFKTNSRNAALLEEYLRVRGEEFLKIQPERVEDPEVVKPGAGKGKAEKIPGKAQSQSRLGFFSRSSKKVPTVEDTPAEGKNETKRKGKDETKEKSETKEQGEIISEDTPRTDGKGSTKGKGRGKSL